MATLIYFNMIGCFSFPQPIDRGKHPRDRELTENFQTHKKEFEELLQLFLEDKKLGRVAYDFTRPEKPETVGVSLARIYEYRKKFDDLGLKAGIEGYDEKEIIWFHVSMQGLSVTGSGKGYAYCKKTPEIVVENLDDYWSSNGKSFTAFKRIEGNWYLYLDYED